MKWGLNDTGHIVWALGEFLFMFFFGDSLFFTVYIHYNKQIVHHGGVGSQQQGKWAQMMPVTLFGLYVSFFWC